MNARQLICIALAAAGALASAAQAQTWPSKPITLAYPNVPGGPTDLIARVLAAQWEKKLGQSVIVESRPGGGGTVAQAYVARAPGDGHTVLVGGAPTAAIFVKNVPYDPFKDVPAVSIVGVQYYYLLGSSKLNIRSLKELIG